ncbi:hypothetical protein LF887_01430 [Chryseobacterium sp. MEBOG06]|uniref:hypothetical protein n=1 Tax=Chryseobacterium sp. MEBOG06 TaxID=2879938 RepID=UPI001F2B7D04|nr:hypothetical protein [Chryseobacterium sp. MEBOG06]UKB84343.1 hypothetical protein LF887_01430 [Chryseobacterium sp. MEBOG06]
MKKYIAPLLLFIFTSILISCEKKDLKIYASINKKDSILILKIENTTEKDFLIEIPTLENFFYEDEFNEIGPEYFGPLTLLIMKKDSSDIKKYIALKCEGIEDHHTLNTNYPKFIDKKSSRKYYYKLVGYKSGRTILLKDDNFKTVIHNLNISVNDKRKEKLMKLKDQTCGNYTYFTGSIKFYPDKIILP